MTLLASAKQEISMSDNSAARLNGDSQEQVAFKLLLLIGDAEKKINGVGRASSDVDKLWILDTYAECLEATKGHRAVKKK